MNRELQNSKNQDTGAFPRINPGYRKGKEEVWAEIEKQIGQVPRVGRSKVVRLNFRFSAAAAILLLIGVTAFMRFYTRTIEAPAGQHLAVLLPDGSKTELNASSSLSYAPYWWMISREVRFEGEGFFEVEKGSRFMVRSPKGTTTVLGTSFNIYSRGRAYEVTCFTGKVKVKAGSGNQPLILHPNEQAKLTEEGQLQYIPQTDPKAVITWTGNMFTFIAVPINTVLDEIERQYAIQISVKGKLDFTYSGNFTKELTAEEVLDVVCTTLGLTFERQPNGEYLVFQN